MENKTCSEIFSERLAELRQQHNETSRDLARALDVSFSAISNYQLGKRTPDIIFLQKVARHYNVSADYLLGLSDVKSTEQDMKIACEVTGLSEKAIENIIKNIKGNSINFYGSDYVYNFVNNEGYCCSREKLIENGNKLFDIQRKAISLFLESDTFTALTECIYVINELANNMIEDFEVYKKTFPEEKEMYVYNRECYKELRLELLDAYEILKTFANHVIQEKGLIITNGFIPYEQEDAPNAQHNPEEE